MSEIRGERRLKQRGWEFADQATRGGLRLARAALDDVVRRTNAGLDRLDAMHRSVVTVLRDGVERFDELAQAGLERVGAAFDAVERAAAPKSPPAAEPGSTRTA